jgi:signal transduction histidine kinase
MAGPAPLSDFGRPDDPAGWLVVREDGSIVAADEQAITLLVARAGAALVGRRWTTLVSPDDAALLAMAVAAFEHGEAWSGRLSLGAGPTTRPLAVSLVPRVPGRGDVAVLQLAPLPAADAAADTPAEPTRDLEVLVETIEAAGELHDPGAIARAVLQSIRPAIGFEWGLVLALRRAPEGATVAAEVVATFPTALAGVDAGATWAPLDPAERALFESGEPSLEGSLGAAPEDRSPLRRLPAFGMRSRIAVPLFAPAGGGVNGAVALYRSQPLAFGAHDGLRLERFVRHLGRAIGVPGLPPSTLPPPGRTPASEPAQPADRGASADQQHQPSPLAGFAAGVAHELNNPLTALLGYAQLLPELAGDERAAALTAIEQEALRAGQLTRDLLAIARQQPPARRPVRLDAVVRRVIDVLQHELDSAQIDVVTDFAPLLSVSADEPQLEQALLHLLRNALDAMPAGGTLTVATSHRDGELRVEVADTGPGILPEAVDQLFEPFFTTYRDSAHRGMGLAIVRGIAESHGGRVWLERSSSSGARFVLALPDAT